MKAVENGQRLLLAFFSKVESTNTASIVLLPLLNPYCSGPSRPWDSAMSVIRPHIRTVRSLRMFDGMVMGRYCAGDKESPPYGLFYIMISVILTILTLYISMHFPKFNSSGTLPSFMIWFKNVRRYCLNLKLLCFRNSLGT